MSANTRLEDLRRRVQQDPSSIAFAQLAEEYRRGGQLQEAVDVCRAGLAIHPGYLSARVTLGRALLELQDLEGAQQELELVLKSAAENLAAIRGLAEIHHRRGSLAEALVQYRAALALARNDPDLEQTVSDLAAQVEPVAPAPEEELSFEPVISTFVAPVQAAEPAKQFTQSENLLNPTFQADADRRAPERAIRIVAALEQWLRAIHASRVERHA
jgi:tetratricopeptide (TPR) repeat protein